MKLKEILGKAPEKDGEGVKAEAPRDPHPIVISFATVKRANLWHGIVIKSRGREIIDEKILESDDYRPVAVDAVDRASHEFWQHGIDPFVEKGE